MSELPSYQALMAVIEQRRTSRAFVADAVIPDAHYDLILEAAQGHVPRREQHRLSQRRCGGHAARTRSGDGEEDSA